MPFFFISGSRHPKAEKHVYIAIPTFGDIKASTVNALNQVQHNLIVNKISFDVALLSGNCHVDDARNDICRMFLQSEATHLMFIDADVQFSAVSVKTLLDFNEKIVCGIYPYKNDNHSYPVLCEKREFNDKGLVEIQGAPGGFMCIEREVIERLYKKNRSKGAWQNKGDAAAGTASIDRGVIPVVEIFHRTIEQGQTRRSGDYEFCRKAIKAGYKIYAAPNLRFGHVGDKIWTGCLQDDWLRESGHYEKEAKAALERLGDNPEIEDFRIIAKAFGNEPWAADPMLLSVLYDTIKAMYPGASVLETGSGVSTAIIQAAGGYPFSFESDSLWGVRTETFLNAVNPVSGRSPSIFYVPIVEHECGRWYSAAKFDGEFDIIFIDGPRRDEPGIRARICDILPNAVRSAKAIIIDDVGDSDGRAFLSRLNKEFGFMFDVYQGPKGEFAVGTRETVSEAETVRTAENAGAQEAA